MRSFKTEEVDVDVGESTSPPVPLSPTVPTTPDNCK